MAKFCGKCGTKLDEQTGKCPNCNKETPAISPQPVEPIIQPKPDANAKKHASRTNAERSVEPKKRKKSKSTAVIFIVILLLVLALVGTFGFLVYNGTLDVPAIDGIFLELGLKDHTSDDVSDGNSSYSIDDSRTDEDSDGLGDNYEVPEFDAEKHFKENTSLIESFDVATSPTISTEADAYEHFVARGFSGDSITYDYDIGGSYLGGTTISKFSSITHPMYQTYHVTESGNIWLVAEVNGDFFATPITYNFSNEGKVPVIISETDSITSYDSNSNKFYVNIPNQGVIKTVEKIDAETLEKLTGEEIDKL